MGAGGAAPPVKSEDVMILIGSTILLTMLVIQAWSTPVSLNCDDDECDFFEVKYDLSEGDEFTLEVQEGEVRPTVILLIYPLPSFRMSSKLATACCVSIFMDRWISVSL